MILLSKPSTFIFHMIWKKNKRWLCPKVCALGSMQFEVIVVVALGEVCRNLLNIKAYLKCSLKMRPRPFQLCIATRFCFDAVAFLERQSFFGRTLVSTGNMTNKCKNLIFRNYDYYYFYKRCLFVLPSNAIHVKPNPQNLVLTKVSKVTSMQADLDTAQPVSAHRAWIQFISTPEVNPIQSAMYPMAPPSLLLVFFLIYASLSLDFLSIPDYSASYKRTFHTIMYLLGCATSPWRCGCSCCSTSVITVLDELSQPPFLPHLVLKLKKSYCCTVCLTLSLGMEQKNTVVEETSASTWMDHELMFGQRQQGRHSHWAGYQNILC